MQKTAENRQKTTNGDYLSRFRESDPNLVLTNIFWWFSGSNQARESGLVHQGCKISSSPGPGQGWWRASARRTWLGLTLEPSRKKWLSKETEDCQEKSLGRWLGRFGKCPILNDVTNIWPSPPQWDEKWINVHIKENMTFKFSI